MLIFVFAAILHYHPQLLVATNEDLDPTKHQLFHTNLSGGGLIEGACTKITDDRLVLVKTAEGKNLSIPLELFEINEQKGICKHFNVQWEDPPNAEYKTDRSDQHPWHSIRGGVLCFGKIVSVHEEIIQIVDAEGKQFRVPFEMLAQGALIRAQSDIAKLDPKLVTHPKKKKEDKISSQQRKLDSVKSGKPERPADQVVASNPKSGPALPNAVGNMKGNSEPTKAESNKPSEVLGNHRRWINAQGEVIATGKFRRRTDLSKLKIVHEKGDDLEIDFRGLSNDHQNYVQLVEAGGRVDIAGDSAAIRREIPADKLRVWKMSNGQVIATGEFIAVKDGKITVFQPDQRTKDIPFDLVSDDDKQYAKAMESGVGPAKAPVGSIVISSQNAAILPTLDKKGLLLVDNDELKRLSADGKKWIATQKLPMQPAQLAEREEYFVLAAENKLVLLRKDTLEVVRNHELWKFQKINNFALHPKRKIAYLSVANSADAVRKNKDERNRVVMVDENTGKIAELDGIYANWLVFHPNGESLFAGYKDVISRFGGIHVNPDGNIIENTKWDNTDILRRYRVKNFDLELEEEFPNAGANGQGLVLSPNGMQIAYLSFTGYPTFSNNIALLNTKSFDKKPTTLATKDLANCRQLAIHPTKPIAASPGQEAIVLFDTKTGKPTSSQPKISEDLLGCMVHQVVFSGDGNHLILQASKGGGERFVGSIRLPTDNSGSTKISDEE